MSRHRFKAMANARRSRSLDALLPILSLRGVSTGDFQEALAAILGKDAPNLSPSVISRLTGEWQQDYDRWQRRDLSARRYVYIWADGVYLHAWETGSQARAGVGRWITFYNHRRPHTAHGGQPPAVVYCNRIETDQQVQAVA